MYFMKALRVEHIKSKRTMLNIIPFALSLIVTICILFICRTSNKDEIVSNSLYYWINISSIAVPLLVGILAGIMGEQEQEAGNTTKAHVEHHRAFGQFSMILLYISIWSVYHPDNFTALLFLKTALIFMVGSLFLVPFQLWSSFYFNMGAGTRSMKSAGRRPRRVSTVR